MNIFIDTCIVYKDPFWKGNFYSKVLEIVKENEINIYASSVVLNELARNYSIIIDSENKKIGDVIERAQHYNFDITGLKLINKKISVKKLNQFYQDLINANVITLLDYVDIDLQEIVKRAVWRKKPFSDTKTELKDAIIWLTYSSYAEKHKLNDCIFLTDNVSDFCNAELIKKGVFEVHPDLQKDSKKFKIYKSPRELIENEIKKLKLATPKFNSWVKKQNFDSRFLLDIIEKYFTDDVQHAIDSRIKYYDLKSIFGEDNCFYGGTGYITSDFFDFESITDVNVELFEKDCLISADLYVGCSVDGYEYNPTADSGEAKYESIGPAYLNIRIIFSFFYDSKEIPSQFDVDHFEIVNAS